MYITPFFDNRQPCILPELNVKGRNTKNSLRTEATLAKGKFQGDALFPLFFDLLVDALAIIMDKARKNGFVKVVLGEYSEGGGGKHVAVC